MIRAALAGPMADPCDRTRDPRKRDKVSKNPKSILDNHPFC